MFQTKRDSRFLRLPDIKEWFIIVEHQQEGPYSLQDLKRDRRFTPDTLVWKKGFQEWIPARFIPEMKLIFKDEPKVKALHESEKGNALESDLGQATLAMQQDPYQFWLWLLVFLLVILYTFYQLYY